MLKKRKKKKSWEISVNDVSPPPPFFFVRVQRGVLSSTFFFFFFSPPRLIFDFSSSPMCLRACACVCVCLPCSCRWFLFSCSLWIVPFSLVFQCLRPATLSPPPPSTPPPPPLPPNPFMGLASPAVRNSVHNPKCPIQQCPPPPSPSTPPTSTRLHLYPHQHGTLLI